MEGTPSTPTDTGRDMVGPTPYNPLKSMRAGLKSDLREDIEFRQNEIALMTRIKEQAKDDPEMQHLLKTIINEELLIIKESWKELNDL